MKHMLLLLSMLGLLLLASPAMAQPAFSMDTLTAKPGHGVTPTSVRVDNGIAADFNEPQDSRFGPGFGGALKLTFDLTPWLDVAPSIMTAQFAPEPEYSATGISGFWAFGGGLRVKRPHNAADGTLWSETSPWLDADAQLISTGNLARFGYSVGAGLSTPMDDARHWWLGPYFRWTEVVDGTQWGGNAKQDHTDASIFQFGLELEFDVAGLKKPAATLPPVATLTTPSTPAVEEKKDEPIVTEVPLQLHRQGMLEYRVHFDFNSAVLHADDKAELDKLAGELNDSSRHPGVTVDSVEVNGHASSENHPWAEKHNQTLSEQRAAAVVAYLVSKGVDEKLLTAKGFGTSESTGLNQPEDRRVEFVLSVTVTVRVLVK